jgi:hypothetical protein
MLRKKSGKQSHSQYPKKYLGNLIKEVKDFYCDNYETLKKETEDTGR